MQSEFWYVGSRRTRFHTVKLFMIFCIDHTTIGYFTPYIPMSARLELDIAQLQKF